MIELFKPNCYGCFVLGIRADEAAGTGGCYCIGRAFGSNCRYVDCAIKGRFYCIIHLTLRGNYDPFAVYNLNQR